MIIGGYSYDATAYDGYCSSGSGDYSLIWDEDDNDKVYAILKQYDIEPM